MPTQADYAKINIACKELNLDKYQLIGDRYGLTSSKDLKPGQLSDLYAHFRSLGWKVKRKKKTKSSPAYADPQMRKVVAMWIELGKAGVVRNSSNAALQAYIKRLVKIDNLEWCDSDQLNNIIESLKSWGKRTGVDFD